MDDLVFLTVMVGEIFFYFGERRIVPDWSRASNPWLVLHESVEVLVDGEPQWSEMLFRPEGSE